MKWMCRAFSPGARRAVSGVVFTVVLIVGSAPGLGLCARRRRVARRGGRDLPSTRYVRSGAGITVRRRPGARITIRDGGQDVSSHPGNVDWAAQKELGSRFTCCKTTQGNWYTNPYFAQQYGGSYDEGLVHAAHHYAEPGKSTPAEECEHFLKNGGGWSAGGCSSPKPWRSRSWSP